MKKNYEVVEYRANRNNVEYSVYQGSKKECKIWLKENCYKDTELMYDQCFTWKYFIREII